MFLYALYAFNTFCYISFYMFLYVFLCFMHDFNMFSFGPQQSRQQGHDRQDPDRNDPDRQGHDRQTDSKL